MVLSVQRVMRQGVVAMVLAIVTAGMARADALDAQNLSHWLEQPNVQFDAVRVPTEGLRTYYAAHQYQTVWVDSQGLTARGAQVLEILDHANAQGLNPELYAVSEIHKVNALPRTDANTVTQIRLSLELLISHAVMHYAADMAGGNSNHQWDTGKSVVAAGDLPGLLEQVASSSDQAAALARLEPATLQYKGLKAALAQYQEIAANGGWPHFTTGKPIKPGMSDVRMATLRHILLANGDLTALASAGSEYDTATVEGIKRFQERHGIEADGVIGTSTQAALSIPLSQRIEQIAMTMERMRWMPADMGSRYVLVNIPGYTLTAVAPGKQLSMNVVVGKPTTKTPMFSKNITDVVLNPSWGVPEKIAVNEMLPKVRKNPGYLSRAGYTVVDASNHAVDPNSIDWGSVGKGNFGYSFRQNPGDSNALGKVKFNIPDSDNIYLHDTSQRGLFVKADRDLSHGCVRLGDPRALTEFVLGSEGWSEAKIESAYESDASRTVHIAPLPVHLVYWTSWVDAQHRVHFGRDIYGMDKTLLASMGSPNRGDDAVKLAMN